MHCFLNFYNADSDPSTIVIVAKKPGTSVNIDVKYIDESYVMDEAFRGSTGEVRGWIVFDIRSPQLILVRDDGCFAI